MVGAEILNRAWREDFLARRRHVVVLPGCMRSRRDQDCRAARGESDLRCTGCAVGCAVRAATEVTTRAGAEAVAVLHGSDFSRFLRSSALRGGDVGVVGVACVPGLLGAGWRARAAGLAAQCVLLDASGCDHWRDPAIPTSLELAELGRVLGGVVTLRPSTRRAGRAASDADLAGDAASSRSSARRARAPRVRYLGGRADPAAVSSAASDRP
jgi:hypothetical protein